MRPANKFSLYVRSKEVMDLFFSEREHMACDSFVLFSSRIANGNTWILALILFRI